MASLGHRYKLQPVSRLGFVTAATSLTGGQPNFARSLAVSWASTLYIHFWGSCPLTELCHMEISLCVQVLRCRILAALLHGTPAAGSAKLCSMVQGMELGNFRRRRHLYSPGRPSRRASAHILVMVAKRNRADHYIFILVLSFFIFSSSNLSRRRLDVYHTSTHGVALVRISDAGLKRCTWLAGNAGPKKVAKNRHLGTIAQFCRAVVSHVRHISTVGIKNLLSSNMSSKCPHNMVNFGLLAAEIGLPVWAPPLISTPCASWQRYCTAVK